MATPLQAVRHARGWSQARAVWEITRLARSKSIGIASSASLKTLLSRWENGHAVPEQFYRDLLCQLYNATPRELGFGGQYLASGAAAANELGMSLIAKHGWTRDDIDALSITFDEAVENSAVADIELLAHEWLSAEPPQLMELRAGRKIGDSLVSTVEHRVIQLRRADDFMSGRTSHSLVRQELRSTTQLLREGALSEGQARRLFTATGELAQLAAWVAADAGLYREAARYIHGGVLAAHAADNWPLAANIISTFSYQLINTGNPRQGALLARAAYAGARRSASATTKALLLERVAWGDAKSGDNSSCQRSLGLVEENFSKSAPDDDPDWVYWLDAGEVNVMAGRCYTERKRPASAEPLLRDAIAHYDNSRIREISLYLSWLAEDYILLDEIDHAAKISAQVLDLASKADSARADARLRHLASMLRRYQEVPTVAEFLDAYRAAG
jgi:transcriptional regulator with XRE-family HTH domain